MLQVCRQDFGVKRLQHPHCGYLKRELRPPNGILNEAGTLSEAFQTVNRKIRRLFKQVCVLLLGRDRLVYRIG